MFIQINIEGATLPELSELENVAQKKLSEIIITKKVNEESKTKGNTSIVLSAATNEEEKDANKAILGKITEILNGSAVANKK